MVLGASVPAGARAAERDRVVIDAIYGATIAKFPTGRKWQPSLWFDGSYGVVGPLHIGAYFQWLGESFGLKNPGFGAGGLLALRKNVKKARLSLGFGGGYLGVPVPSDVPNAPFRHEGAGTITVIGGIGYGFLSFLGIDLRGRWARYFRMPVGTPDNAWSLEAGLTFFFK